MGRPVYIVRRNSIKRDRTTKKKATIRNRLASRFTHTKTDKYRCAVSTAGSLMDPINISGTETGTYSRSPSRKLPRKMGRIGSHFVLIGCFPVLLSLLGYLDLSDPVGTHPKKTRFPTVFLLSILVP